MSKLAYIYHPVFLKHDAGSFHPENYKRLNAINSYLNQIGFMQKMEIIEPEAADLAMIELVHSKSYVQKISETVKQEQSILDQGDTFAGEFSFEAALHAAGSVTKGIDLLAANQFDKIFCAVRPPGHHAEYNYASGFCIFNNIAIAARYAQQKGYAKKILIIDWDVHHGNGTQHTFESDPNVFYYSIHQFPFFPGTGAEHEIGLDEGAGYTMNRPLKSGYADQEYLDVFEKDLISIQNKFKPDLILTSAGFDGHKDDPLAGMLLTENAYGKITELLLELAWKYTNGKILSVLEGGYNLSALAKSVEAHLDVLLNN